MSRCRYEIWNARDQIFLRTCALGVCSFCHAFRPSCHTGVKVTRQPPCHFDAGVKVTRRRQSDMRLVTCHFDATCILQVISLTEGIVYWVRLIMPQVIMPQVILPKDHYAPGHYAPRSVCPYITMPQVTMPKVIMPQVIMPQTGKKNLEKFSVIFQIRMSLCPKIIMTQIIVPQAVVPQVIMPRT